MLNSKVATREKEKKSWVGLLCKSHIFVATTTYFDQLLKTEHLIQAIEIDPVTLQMLLILV